MLIQLKNYFKFDEKNAILKKEIIGGLTTFLAVCYILAVNPSMVSIAAGFDKQGGLFLATALSSFAATLFMGLWARVPVTLAPGMGLNAFFTFTVAGALGSGTGIGFESALSCTILSGILYFIVAMTPAREYISKQIPHNFKIAVGAGIGLFIAYLGLQNSGIVKAGTALATELGRFDNPLIILALCLTFLGLILHFAKVPGALIITMLVGAVILIILSTTGVVNKGVENYGLLGSYDDFSSFGYVASAGWLGFANSTMWTSPITYIAVLSFFYTDFFDTTGTLIAINRLADFDRTDPKWMAKANQVDALGTIFGAGIGATTVTSYVESTVGVSAGARTGLAAVVSALCFGVAIAAWPVMQVFMPVVIDSAVSNAPTFQPITSPVLIIVGVIMLTQLKHFEWEIAVDIPMLFMTLVFTLFTNSISYGLSYGMITYVIMNAALGSIQHIRQTKKIVNDDTIPYADDIQYDKVKTREFNYLKRLNVTTIVIAVAAVAFIVLDSCTKLGLFN